ncbi:MAG: cupin domain-containing protein [Thermomicrobiales bacterium]|nr:cupin domain-containing protein [Thermomicrobiales bacterium]
MRLLAEDVIARLGLRPLPGEGGYFTESYRSGWSLSPDVIPGDYPGERLAATAIYFLVTPDQFSALHRLRGDELWHFYLGDPVELVTIDPDGRVNTISMGHELTAGQVPQALAPAGTWLGCALANGGEWALLGTTMTPGFHPDDFELADRARLLAAYPHAAGVIHHLTRAGSGHPVPAFG